MTSRAPFEQRWWARQPHLLLGDHEPGRGWRARWRPRPAVEEKFGSFTTFKEEVKNAGVGQFGSGWAWLIHDS